ncbi:MAG: DUF5681 domain-containing protein [Syntrophobacteraceae bacterium]
MPFEKGQSGNPNGKPRGTRNRTTVIAQALLDGKAETLVEKVVELALAGDVTCLRIDCNPSNSTPGFSTCCRTNLPRTCRSPEKGRAD